MRRTALLTFGSALLVAAPAPAPARAQGPVARVDSIFRFIPADAPGCAVGVSQRGQVLVNRAYGLADVDRKVPLSPASKFDIGSTQKQFTAASILLLARDGRLALSDDIRKHLPELPDYGRPVTIDHLLTHTGGVRDWTGLAPLAPEGTDVVQLILRQRGLNFLPGEQWAYSNGGYELLKEIVARASGTSFAEFTRRRLFEPLGMTSSAYVKDILQGTGERAIGYQQDGNGWKPYMRLGANRGGGAVISTPGDLLVWNDALTNGRLGREITAKLEEPAKLRNGRTLTYARGLNVNVIPGGRMVSHSGGAWGYSTWLGRFTDHGLSIAVTCNFDPVSATQLAGRVADLFLPPVDRAAQPPGPVAAPGVDVSGRAGLFFDDRTGEPLRLVANGGRLAVANGPPLVAVSAERFRPPRASLFFRSEGDIEIAFRSDDELEIRSKEGEVARYRRAQPWTPSPAERQGIDGRYESAEIGGAMELVTGAQGITLRLAGAPDRSIELEPVARDTYMRSLVIVRLRRDAAGKVTGFTYGNPVASGMLYERVGERAGRAAATPPAANAPAPAPPATRPPALEGLVGEYELVQGRSIVVTLEGGRLYGEPTGNPRRALAHVSGSTFSVEGAPNPITVTFTLGADGKATGMVMRQNGQERSLTRIR